MDERLRAAERAAGTGDHSEQVGLLREQMRAGTVTEADVLARAAHNDKVALDVLGLTLPQAAMIASVGLGAKIKDSSSARSAIRSYFRAKGFVEDRYGALVGGEGDRQIRLVFKDRVVQEFHGRPGDWRKHGSESTIRYAERLLAAAHGPAAKEELREKRQSQKRKTVERRETQIENRNVLRAAAVLLSLDLTPEERRLSVADSTDLSRRALEIVPDVESHIASGVRKEQIDAMLSSSAPPVFLNEGSVAWSLMRKRAPEWPTSYKWTDASSGLDVEVSRPSGRESISIIIGNVPVDPVSGGVIGARMFSAIQEGYTGLSGLIRVDMYGQQQAQLYYIQSQERRTGMARRMIRVFCRIVAAYGFDHFVALGVGPDGQALLDGLAEQGEIVIFGRNQSSVFVRCAGALDDPRQQRLFGPQPKLNR